MNHCQCLSERKSQAGRISVRCVSQGLFAEDEQRVKEIARVKQAGQIQNHAAASLRSASSWDTHEYHMHKHIARRAKELDGRTRVGVMPALREHSGRRVVDCGRRCGGALDGRGLAGDVEGEAPSAGRMCARTACARASESAIWTCRWACGYGGYCTFADAREAHRDGAMSGSDEHIVELHQHLWAYGSGRISGAARSCLASRSAPGRAWTGGTARAWPSGPANLRRKMTCATAPRRAGPWAIAPRARVRRQHRRPNCKCVARRCANGKRG